MGSYGNETAFYGICKKNNIVHPLAIPHGLIMALQSFITQVLHPGYRQTWSLQFLRKHFIKGHGLVQCYFPRTAQILLQPSISFLKNLGIRFEHGRRQS